MNCLHGIVYTILYSIYDMYMYSISYIDITYKCGHIYNYIYDIYIQYNYSRLFHIQLFSEDLGDLERHICPTGNIWMEPATLVMYNATN